MTCCFQKTPVNISRSWPLFNPVPRLGALWLLQSMALGQTLSSVSRGKVEGFLITGNSLQQELLEVLDQFFTVQKICAVLERVKDFKAG